MPRRIPKACRESRCPLTTTESHGYCASHEFKAKQWQGSGRGRGGRPWRRLREQVKQQANGLCAHCLNESITKLGSICDHIIPEAEGGPTTLPNLQWLCVKHSDTKTKEEAKRGIHRTYSKGGAG